MLGRAEIIAGGGKACLKTGYVSKVGKTPESIGINNDATIIENIGKRDELMEILEDLSLAPTRGRGNCSG